MTYSNSHDAEMAGLAFNDELKRAIADVGVLESEMNDYRRRELEIKLLKNKLDEGIRRGQENIKRLRIEIADAKTIFWQLKNDGL